MGGVLHCKHHLAQQNKIFMPMPNIVPLNKTKCPCLTSYFSTKLYAHAKHCTYHSPCPNSYVNTSGHVCSYLALSLNLSISRRKKNFYKCFQMRPNAETLPNASGCIRMCPSTSEHIRTGPNRSKCCGKRTKTSKS